MSTLMVYYNNMGNSSYALENSVTVYGREISYTNIKKGKVIPPSEGMTLPFFVWELRHTGVSAYGKGGEHGA